MTYTVHEADVLEALRAMDSDSYHGALSDPPYGLTTDGGKTGFMGHAWDKGVPPAEVWREVLRVLKPGAYLLAFGGTRTFHRLTCAIEDAGFEIRDSIAEFFDQDAATQAFLAGLSPAQRKDFDRAFVGSPIECYLYGSGFPKSHDVSKAIDKANGDWRGKAGAPSSANAAMGGPNYARTPKGAPIAAAVQFAGHGSALKPAHEPVIVARKPLDGTVAANVQRWGCGALAIDASRVPGAKRGNGRFGPIAAQGRILDDGLGRWPANVILSHSPGCIEVGTREVVNRGGHGGNRPGETRVSYSGGYKTEGGPTGIGETKAGTKYMRSEKVSAYECADGCPVKALDAQTGWAKSRKNAIFSDNVGAGPSGARFGDSGGASRFFKQCDFSQDEVVFSRAMAMLDACNFDHASIANAHSSQPKPRAVSALSDVVTLASRGETRLLGWTAHFTTATPSESKTLSASLIATILSFDEGSSQEQRRERSFPTGSRASVAQPQRQTGTTTITISHWRSDGSAEPVTFSTTPLNSGHGEAGSSRFIYCAKASRAERDAGLDGFESSSSPVHGYATLPDKRMVREQARNNPRNVHPTVKPLALTTYLARLILPPVEGTRLLVPFCGSGSEMIGGLRAGWSHVEGIDAWDVAVKIARARLAHHEAQTEPANDEQLTLDVGT